MLTTKMLSLVKSLTLFVSLLIPGVAWMMYRQQQSSLKAKEREATAFRDYSKKLEQDLIDTSIIHEQINRATDDEVVKELQQYVAS